MPIDHFNICKKLVPPASVAGILLSPIHGTSVITELQLIIDLPSIVEMPTYAEDPLLTEEQRNALFWQNALTAKSKKIVVTFQEGSESPIELLNFLIFNRRPYYVENLLSRFTAFNELIVASGNSISIAVRNSNSGLLVGNDSITIWGRGYYLFD